MPLNSLGFACQPLMPPESTTSLSPRGWRSSSPTSMRLAWFRSARAAEFSCCAPCSHPPCHTRWDPKACPCRDMFAANASNRGLAGQTGAADTHDHGARHGGRQGGHGPHGSELPSSRTGLADWAGSKFPCPGPCHVSTRLPVSWGQWQSITTAVIRRNG